MLRCSATSPGVLSNGMASSTLTGVFHASVTATTAGGSGVNTASQTALAASNWDKYIDELMASAVFTTQLTATGSGIAGLMAGASSVTRGTQTELIGSGLGSQPHGRPNCLFSGRPRILE